MLALVLLAVTAVLGLPTETRAHSQTTDGYSRITVRGDAIRYHLSLDFDELRRVTSLDVPPVATTAEREAALLRDRSGILAYLEPRLVLRMDEVSCQGAVAQTRVENISGQVYAGIVLEFTCPGGAAGRLHVRYGVYFDDQDPQHRNIATYGLPGHNGRFIFARDARELTVGEGTSAGSVRRFIVLGFEHILAGYDHVLFVLALLLGARGLRGVLTVATVFTLAHSATLGLAVLGWAALPGAVVEPLIALSIAYTAVVEPLIVLSIAYTAVANLVAPESRRRLAVVFGFGLLHGLGFAGALQLGGEVDAQMLLSLLGFNVGVELGQTLIILLVFPALLWARRFAWSVPARAVATSCIGVAGLMWFVERLSV